MPKWTYLPEFQKNKARFKERQKTDFDHRHQTRETLDIPNDTDVRVFTGQESVRGTVTTSTEQPRSYMGSTPSGDLRQNRSHLNIVSPSEQPPTITDNKSPSSVSADLRPPIIMTRSRTGTVISRPDYL